jgi:hypothetical protein
MNTGIPAVSGEGAMGALTPFEIPACDLKADQFVDPNKMVPFPRNWPAHRVPTPEEQARMLAAMQRREQLMESTP